MGHECKLTPACRSIGDFRKDNAEALKALARDFVQACREFKLIGGKRLGIDGSHSKANARPGSVKPDRQLAEEFDALERKIERYRSEHANAITAHRTRMATPAAKARMRERAARFEHPFGTLKRWLGADHFRQFR